MFDKIKKLVKRPPNGEQTREELAEAIRKSATDREDRERHEERIDQCQEQYDRAMSIFQSKGVQL